LLFSLLYIEQQTVQLPGGRMKLNLVILSMIFYLAGTSLSYAAQAFCSPDSSAVSVLLAEEDGKKQDEETTSPEEEECE
jgi:hypothetical protein